MNVFRNGMNSFQKGMNVFRNGMNSFQNGMNNFQSGMKSFWIDTGIWNSAKNKTFYVGKGYGLWKHNLQFPSSSCSRKEKGRIVTFEGYMWNKFIPERYESILERNEFIPDRNYGIVMNSFPSGMNSYRSGIH